MMLVVPSDLYTVNVFVLPTFLIKNDWPVETWVAAGKINLRLVVVAVTSIMLATTVELFPLTGHCKVVFALIVKLS